MSTPGYQGDDSDTSRRNKVIRILMGVVLLAAGLVVIIVAG